MPFINSFEEFLIEKNEESKKHPIDWELRKINWLDSIDKLYQNIRLWLDPYIQKQLIVIREKEISVNEEHIGEYLTKRLDIYIGNDIVYLIPRGTLVYGAFGRIDMNGSKKDLTIIQPKWNHWKFSGILSKMQTHPLNNKTFINAIQEVVNG